MKLVIITIKYKRNKLILPNKTNNGDPKAPIMYVRFFSSHPSEETYSYQSR